MLIVEKIDGDDGEENGISPTRALSSRKQYQFWHPSGSCNNEVLATNPLIYWFIRIAASSLRMFRKAC
jgi:hypothetical protein